MAFIRRVFLGVLEKRFGDAGLKDVMVGGGVLVRNTGEKYLVSFMFNSFNHRLYCLYFILLTATGLF